MNAGATSQVESDINKGKGAASDLELFEDAEKICDSNYVMTEERETLSNRINRLVAIGVVFDQPIREALLARRYKDDCRPLVSGESNDFEAACDRVLPFARTCLCVCDGDESLQGAPDLSAFDDFDPINPNCCGVAPDDESRASIMETCIMSFLVVPMTRMAETSNISFLYLRFRIGLSIVMSSLSGHLPRDQCYTLQIATPKACC